MDEFPKLKAKIRDVRDFPTQGINFKDITPLLEDGGAFAEAINGLAGFCKNKNIRKVIGIDARGFLLASAVAYVLGVGVVIVRKKGKLPWEKILREHDLEYGRGSLEMHVDSIKKGERVAVIDDVLATGGTAEAAIKLAEDLGGEIACVGFLLELPLGGREKLSNYEIKSLIKY